MKKFIIPLISFAMASLALFSCGSNDEPLPPITPDDIPEVPKPGNDGSKRTILVYMVASNLYSDLKNDQEEMLEGMQNVDLDKYHLVVFEAMRDGSATLYEVTRNEENTEFLSIKTYDYNLLPTDPKRMSEVIADTKALRPAESYGIVFWAHGSAWSPGNNFHDVPITYAYGGDLSSGVYDWTNIDEMATAIPDGAFDFIWFDNCYMSSIEVMYQLRNKTKYIVAYPTEIYTPGMPYDDTMPLLMKPEADLVGAAKATFNYYDFLNMAATVCVVDMAHIEDVASICRKANASFTPVATAGLQYYSRGSYGPYYDFTQYTIREGENKTDFNADELNSVMSRFVLYKACSKKDFNNRPIDAGVYSGISTHAYGQSGNKDDDYYRTLDWYKRILGDGSSSVPMIPN